MTYIGVEMRHLDLDLRFKGPIHLNYNALVFMHFYAKVMFQFPTPYPSMMHTSIGATQVPSLRHNSVL